MLGGLIWQGLLAADVTLEPLLIELFMRIYSLAELGTCRVLEGGLFVYRSRPCIRACITSGFSKTPLELIHIYLLFSERYAARSSAK